MTSVIKTGVVLAVLLLLGGGGSGGGSVPVRIAEKAREPLRQVFVGGPAAAERGRIAEYEAEYLQLVEALRGRGRPGRGTAPPLVIPSGKTDPADLAAIVEDLAVMSRLLGKALERDLPKDYRQPPTPGSRIIFYPDYERIRPQQGPQPVYLQGYGALFVTSIKFPLVSPPTQKHEEDKEEADSAWERARREVYGPPELPRPSGPAGPTYDAEKVEALKRTLLAALKHASNMRGLKPDESVAIAVLGGATPGRGVQDPVSGLFSGSGMFLGVPGYAVEGGGFGGGGGGLGGGFGGPPILSKVPVLKRVPKGPVVPGTAVPPGYLPPEAMPGYMGDRVIDDFGPRAGIGVPGQRTVLTVHVTKADVDAYAEGKLDSAGFREKATITAYSTPGPLALPAVPRR